MIQTESSMEITRNLLVALGLEIQKDTNLLYDQETKSPIFFEGQALKANIDPNKSLFIGEDEIKFDPLDPKYTKMMERMFGKFLEDSEENEMITHCLSYYFDRDTEANKYQLTIKFEKKMESDPDRWVGNWFINKILAYVEAIFHIDGTFADTDLTPYDIDYDLLEEEEEKKGKK